MKSLCVTFIVVLLLFGSVLLFAYNVRISSGLYLIRIDNLEQYATIQQGDMPAIRVVSITDSVYGGDLKVLRTTSHKRFGKDRPFVDNAVSNWLESLHVAFQDMEAR